MPKVGGPGPRSLKKVGGPLAHMAHTAPPPLLQDTFVLNFIWRVSLQKPNNAIFRNFKMRLHVPYFLLKIFLILNDSTQVRKILKIQYMVKSIAYFLIIFFIFQQFQLQIS